MRILLVEDDSMIAQAVVGSLKDDGYAVDWVNNGNTAETTLAGQNYDIILLDLGLPGQDGIQVLQHARATHNTTPILILTARDDIQSRLAGLDGGADDYIIKPFIMAELKARIRAILRRTHAIENQDDGVVRVADLVLDEDAHEVYRAEVEVDLSPTEFKLLRYLMLNAGRVVSKAQILDHVWEYDWNGDAAIVESYISYLRRKIDQVEGQDGQIVTPLIQTRRGVGYMLREPKAE